MAAVMQNETGIKDGGNLMPFPMQKKRTKKMYSSLVEKGCRAQIYTRMRNHHCREEKI